MTKRFSSLLEVRSAIDANQITLPQLVDHYLDRISTQQQLNAILEVFSDEAKTQAQLIQDKIKQGNAGKLAGMVMAIKDNIVYKDHHASAASKILSGFTSLFSATVVERLLAEDAIIIARTN
jgi:aspartyl-tRNA(Asn)/glutamyl-tRNA(Gln) amidotransferase subunit A